MTVARTNGERPSRRERRPAAPTSTPPAPWAQDRARGRRLGRSRTGAGRSHRTLANRNRGPYQEPWTFDGSRPSAALIAPDVAGPRFAGVRFTLAAERLGVPLLLCVTADSLARGVPESVDDFVEVPCSGGELEHRLRRLLRGRATLDPGTLTLGGVSLDLATYRAKVDGRSAQLAWMEFRLLRFLMENPGRVHSREALLAEVWGEDYRGGSRTVDVHVRRLRHKLGRAERQSRTVRTVGYGFEA